MEPKELGTSSSIEMLCEKEKLVMKEHLNKKRKLNSVEDEEDNDVDHGNVIVNGAVLAKKKKKKSKVNNKQSQEGRKGHKPFITLQLKKHFKKELKKNLDCRLKMTDIQDLMLYGILRQTISSAPNWCQLAHRKKLKKVVVILLRAVGENDFSQYPTCFPFINKELLSVVVSTKASGTDFCFEHPHETLLSVALSKSQQKKKRKKLQECNETGDIDVPKDKSFYLLTKAQLKSNKYPIKCYDDKADDKDGFMPAVTQETSSVDSTEQSVFALDCEMCLTSEGQELTRISIVDESLNVLYDTLVKPDRPILDYKTEFSGITAESLEGVTVTLQDVQKQVQTLIPHGAILAGHSFEFDLNALKMYHTNIIDTSIMYSDKRGPHFKPALKFLASCYLKKNIQKSSTGHCSIEDAKTCMELVKLKFEKGPNFGFTEKETEGLFTRMNRESKICSMIDYPYMASFDQSGGHHVVSCTSDSDIVSNAANQIKLSDFVWIHLHGAQEFYNASTKKIQNENQAEEKEEVLKTLDCRVRDIYQDIPENCLTFVVMGCGDVRQVLRLQKDPEPRTEELRGAVREAKKGVCFIKIT